jgi:maleylacetate reductase
MNGSAAEVGERLGDRFAGLFAGAVMHTPVGVTGEALRRAADLRADGVVAVGGGSTVGLGKAIALRTGLPQIAIPTTLRHTAKSLPQRCFQRRP